MDENVLPKKRSFVYTELFTLRVTPEFKSIVVRMKGKGYDTADIARSLLAAGFLDAEKQAEEKEKVG